MAKQSRLVIRYEDDEKEVLFLSFEENGRCTGRDEDGLCVLTNIGLGGFVGTLAGRLYPANQQDRQYMIQALARHRAILESFNVDKISKKSSEELKVWAKDTKKELKNINAEIARLTKNRKKEDENESNKQIP